MELRSRRYYFTFLTILIAILFNILAIDLFAAKQRIPILSVSDVHKIDKSGPENTPITFIASDFINSFVDFIPSSNLVAVKVGHYPTHGTVYLYDTPLTTTQEIDLEEIEGLSYVPIDNWYGYDYFLWMGYDNNGYWSSNAANINITINPDPAPTFASITPASGNLGATVAITSLTGANFVPSTTVKLQNGTDEINATDVVVVSPTEITCQFLLAAGSTIGPWDLVIIHPDGQTAVASEAFTLNPKALVSIAVTPDNPTIPNGTTQQFSATGTYTDGSTADITDSVSWSSSDPTTATIDSSTGLATAVANFGSTTITATAEEISETTTLSTTAAILEEITITPTNPFTPLGATQQFTAIGTYSDSSTADLTNSVTWSSNNSSVATINSSGLASTVAEGTTEISATQDSIISPIQTLTVEPKALVAIAITPNNPSIAKGLTQQFTATGTYTDSSTADITNSVTWSSSDTGVATMNSSGLATTITEGTTEISATQDSITSPTRTLTVEPKALVAIAITPNNPSIAKGLTQQFTATGTYTDSSTADITNSVAWSSNNTSVATINSSGLATTITEGTTEISATQDSITSPTQTLTVEQKALVAIAVTPDNPNVAKGLTQQFTATGTYTDSSTADITSSVTWSSNDTNVATIDNFGLASTLAEGTAVITAIQDSITSPTQTLTVTPKALISIAITPNNPSVAKGLTQQFTATGTYTDSSTADITNSVSWSSTDTNVATIDSSGLTSTITEGVTTITAIQDSITSPTQTLTVEPKVLVSIAVSPNSPSIAKGLTQQFTATGIYTDSSTADITNSVSWNSNNTGTATIDSSGLATTITEGTTEISATQDSIISPIQTLTVEPKALVAIAITPNNPSIAKGLTQQFTATGTYTDSSTADITNSVTWSSNDTNVAIINNSGLASTLAEGTAVITAIQDSITSPTQTLTVTPKALISIAITPNNPSVAKGLTQQFTATGTYTDSSTADITNSVTWSSNDINVATIDSFGLASTITEGITTITATQDSITSPTQTLTVEQKALVAIAVTPNSPSIAKGLTQQFTATGTYTDNSTAHLTNNISWNSSSSSTATIDSSGLVSTLSEGTTAISATQGSITSPSQTLTVTSKELVAIAVTPNNPSIAKGLTQQFTATGTYTDSSTADITNSVSWNSNDTNVATIDSSGLTSTITEGVTTITATQDNITSLSQTLTVTSKELVAIVVAPNNPSIAKGLTQQFTATGTYTDSSTADITNSVAWSSNNTSVATINSSGLATTITEGTTEISATQDSIISPIQTLTVEPKALVAIAITPNNPSAAKGLTQQFTATGTYTDSSTADITNSVSWNSNNTGTATIDSSGLATTITEGTTEISATQDSITSPNQTLTVTHKELIAIAVTPDNPSIAKGLTQQFTATGTYTDSSTADITNSVTWNSNDINVATIDSFGLATTITEGTTEISAIQDNITSPNQALTVTHKELVAIAVTPNSPSIAKGLTQQFTAIGTYTDSSTTDLTNSVTWSSSNTGVATMNSSGLASTLAEGSTVISATQGSITSPSQTLTVTSKELVAIAVTPNSPSIAKGLTQQFTATGTYTDNSTADITNNVSWNSSSSSTATIDSSGLASTLAEGSTAISATQGSITSPSQTLTVTSKELVAIVVAPNNPSIAIGLTQQFTATGTYTDNSTADLTNNVNWSSNDTNVATIDGFGLATTITEGVTTITATQNSITSPSQTLTVEQKALVAIAITPNNPSIAKGLTQQFTATGTYTDSSTADITNSVTWSSNDTNVATIDNFGLASTLAEGSTTISATHGSITSPTQTLTVEPKALVAIAVIPDNPNVAKGLTQQFTATGTYTDSSTADITNSVTWSSNDTNVAIINNSGLASTLAEGTTAITATQDSITSPNQTVTVTSKELVAIVVTPNNPSIAKGLTQQFIATGTYTDSSTADLTNSVSWHSNDTNVATINGSGLAITLVEGTTVITATQDSITSPTQTLIVNPKVLVSIAVTSNSPSIAKGLTQQFTATGTYTDNSTADITNNVSWNSSSSSTATIDSSGLASTLAEGSTAISATQGSITSPSQTLTVEPKALVAIAITPNSSNIAKGLTQQFTATATYTDNSTADITDSVSWNSNDIAVATINNNGLATTITEGTTAITATQESITSPSQTLTVEPKALVAIAITPNSSSIAKGLTQQFTATGTYTDNSIADITNSVTWNSSDTNIATINNNGLAISIAPGTTNIVASLSEQTSNTQMLTVGPKELVTITITPMNSIMAQETTKQLLATGTYTDNSTADLTNSVTWSSSNSNIASIATNTGLLTTKNIGTVKITAALLGTTSQPDITLTVIPKPIVSMIYKSGPENQAVHFNLSDFATHFNNSNLTSLAKIKITDLPKNGTLTLGTPVFINQEIPKDALGDLQLIPIIAGNDEFSWNGYDGVAYASLEAKVNIAIASIPILNTITKQGKENTKLTFNANDFTTHFNQATYKRETEYLTAIKIVSLPQHGTLYLFGVPVAIAQEIPLTQLNGLSYVPYLNYSGCDNFRWNGSNGILYAVNAANIQLLILPTPVLNTITKLINRDETIRFNTSDFTRYIDQATHDLAKIKIIKLPLKGQLKLAGEAFELPKEIAVANLTQLTYTPEMELGSDSFSWSGSDGTTYATNLANVNIHITKPVAQGNSWNLWAINLISGTTAAAVSFITAVIANKYFIQGAKTQNSSTRRIGLEP